MHVFLTGGTGLIGAAVARRLQDDGHSVVGLARSDEAAQQLTDNGLGVVRGTLLDADVLAGAAASADGVVHTASPSDHTSGHVDRVSVDAMVDALTGTTKPFVYTSGLWLHGSSPESITEDSLLNPPDIVAWRPAVEADVLAAADRGVRAVSIRPGVVYGYFAGLPAMLAGPAAEQGVVRYVGDGTNRWSPVHVDDLADLYVRALATAPNGSVYLGVSGETITLAEAARAAARGAGLADTATTSWPVEQARQALGPLADALILDQAADNRRARSELGWSPTRPSLLDDLELGSYRTAPR